MKRSWYGLVTAVALLLTGPHAIANAMQAEMAPSPAISITLDGYPLETRPAPFQYNNRTMVPFRVLAESLGIRVQWEAATSTIHATHDDLTLQLQINNRTALVNGQQVQLDAEPVTLNDRAMIPLRFFSENMGAEVGWDGTTHTVSIHSQPRKLDTMVFYGLGSYAKRGYLPKFDEATFTWSILDENSRFATDKSEYRWPSEGASELLQEVKTAQVGTSLMVFSANEHGEITKLIQDAALQAKFVDDLVAKVKAEQLGSVVLDLESLREADKAAYTAFVKQVADALHAQGKKLDVVVHPLNGWFPGYDYKGLAASADRLFVMAYSYTDEKWPQPIDKVNEALTLALQQVDKSKLMLGINAYSETPQSVREKIGLAKRYGLAGVGFWILVSFDDPFMKAIDDMLIMHDEQAADEPTTP